ncbi:MAG: NAD-dependent deacylase [Anaerolineales bacterium]|nr:MAG: NAD-dependent deacylase [Anaerolineales bacterium]
MDHQSRELTQKIHHAVDIIRGSTKSVVLTGAGISTPSGIPDFRSSGTGLWSRYDPFEYASINAFRHHPQKFFDWMRPLAKLIQAAEPNAAHIGLAQLENAGFLQTVITQNIDGLHQRAGSRNVLEVHGTFTSLTCVRCFHKYDSRDFVQSYLEQGEIPHCPDCECILKPDVVLFGEQLPHQAWLGAHEASKSCDLMIAAGSSLEVLPVAALPVRALDHGARLIVINQMETYIDVRADIVFGDDVAKIIPLIVREVIDG